MKFKAFGSHRGSPKGLVESEKPYSGDSLNFLLNLSCTFRTTTHKERID